MEIVKWGEYAALKMTCAMPPLESSRGLFKAAFELKYEVFVVFSRTSSISIFLFALLLFISSKMFADRFLFKQRNIHCCAICIFNCINISAFYIVQILLFSWYFSFSCPSISRFLMTFQNFTLERPSVFHMHRSFNENLHAGYATSLHDET